MSCHYAISCQVNLLLWKDTIMKSRRKGEYQDWSAWTKRIWLAILLVIIFYLIYLVGALVWEKLSSIKHSYESAQMTPGIEYPLKFSV
jgi:hypothetical protein